MRKLLEKYIFLSTEDLKSPLEIIRKYVLFIFFEGDLNKVKLIEVLYIPGDLIDSHLCWKNILLSGLFDEVNVFA